MCERLITIPEGKGFFSILERVWKINIIRSEQLCPIQLVNFSPAWTLCERSITQ